MTRGWGQLLEGRQTICLKFLITAFSNSNRIKQVRREQNNKKARMLKALAWETDPNWTIQKLPAKKQF